MVYLNYLNYDLLYLKTKSRKINKFAITRKHLGEIISESFFEKIIYEFSK